MKYEEYCRENGEPETKEDAFSAGAIYTINLFFNFLYTGTTNDHIKRVIERLEELDC